MQNNVLHIHYSFSYLLLKYDFLYLQIQQKFSSANSGGDDGVYDHSKLWISPQDTMDKASFHLKTQTESMRNM